jgi:hypothetical protein
MQIHDALEQLLKCAKAQLLTPVCRSFIHPGSNAPHDSCEESNGSNGQLWVANITSIAGWPAPTGNPITCATPFAETIELGITRCALGKLRDVSPFVPKPEDVTADAVQQQIDKLALKNAILCCWGVSGKDLLPPIWEPIEPQGGCVGGTWTIVIRDASCLCEPVMAECD